MTSDRQDEDRLFPDELVAVGSGSCQALLFENASLGLQLHLTWRFSATCQEVSRRFSLIEVSVDVDWLPLPVWSWRSLAGCQVTSTGFGDPAEGSVRFFDDHQFDTVQVRVLEQRGAHLHVETSVRGDLDGLGVDPVRVTAWLRFEGIVVHLKGVTSSSAADTRLRDHRPHRSGAVDCPPGPVCTGAELTRVRAHHLTRLRLSDVG